jgi:TolB-like protein
VVFSFTDFILDTERRELRRGSAAVPLEPQVFDLLVTLVRNRERVLSKDYLIETVWQGRIVSDSAVAARINAARKAVGDDGLAQRLIRTIPRRGVRFVGEVREDSAPAAPAPGNPALPDKPSIAVLPFQNLSGDPQQEYFVDGMVEEIITALCRIRWLFVIARNSTFVYKGQAVDVKAVGHELGVRYVLEGSVRKAGEQVRITAQLIDAFTGTHLWAERFDGALADVFRLQDEVASSVAGNIEPALQVAETVRRAAQPTDDLTAYDLYLRAYALYFDSAARVPDALGLLEQAIERDPHYGPALAWAAVCYFQRGGIARPGKDREANRQQGIDLARRALAAAKSDPGTMASAALALGGCGEDIGPLLALIDRALSLHPSFAYGWRVSGALRLWAGFPEIAIEHVDMSLRFDPRGGISRAFQILGVAHFVQRRFDEAERNLLISIQDDPNYVVPYRFLAACYAQMGRLHDARAIYVRLQAITTIEMGDFDLLRNPGHRELAVSGLRLAAAQVNQRDRGMIRGDKPSHR